MGEVITVLSGKGGTGKTSVCAGVSVALAQLGSRVLCIDCDVGLRNLDIALGLSDLEAISFLDVCSGHYSPENALCHPVYPRLFFLTAPVDCTASEIDPAAFRAMLKAAEASFDYVLLDAPAGVEAGFALAADWSDRILLVTGADPASVRDAARAGVLLEQMGKKNVRLIVNRISKKLASALGLTVDDIMDETGLPLMGLVPEDPNVTLAAAFRQPLLGFTRGGAAAACRRIAKRLRGQNVPVRI